MRRWLFMGVAFGAIGPILVPIEIALRLYLPDMLMLVLFPFSIVMMAWDSQPFFNQLPIYLVLTMLNVVYFSAILLGLRGIVNFIRRGLDKR